MRNYSLENLRRVRGLRREMSASEDVLWEMLRNRRLGYKFKRQYPVDQYVLDFYCSEARLCIEVDGEQHVFRQSADRIRDAHLQGLGITTLRIPSLDLFDESGLLQARWVEKILDLCVAGFARRTLTP